MESFKPWLYKFHKPGLYKFLRLCRFPRFNVFTFRWTSLLFPCARTVYRLLTPISHSLYSVIGLQPIMIIIRYHKFGTVALTTSHWCLTLCIFDVLAQFNTVIVAKVTSHSLTVWLISLAMFDYIRKFWLCFVVLFRGLDTTEVIMYFRPARPEWERV